MAHYEENLMDEWEADEAEGQSEAYDELDGLDEGDELEAVDGMDELDELDEGDEMDGLDEAEGMDSWDEYEEGDESSGEDSIDQALAFALAAEDSDEFFRRLARVARRVVSTAANVARRAAPIIGQVARAAAPILSVIPHPAAQIASRVAGVLGRLQMEGASEEEALEAMSELAARHRSVAPIAAAIAARALMRGAAATATPAARARAVHQVRQAAQTLVNARGPAAVRALPRVVRSVRRTAAVRQTPTRQRPQVALNTARRVAANPTMLRRLARPLPRGNAIVARVVRGTGSGVPGVTPNVNWGSGNMGVPRCNCGASHGPNRGRSFVIRGPVRITRL
jgi:hypothetical protein